MKKYVSDFNTFLNEAKNNGGLEITNGQHKDIMKSFPYYDRDRSFVIAEGGNDNGETFDGSFLVQIYLKRKKYRFGVYRFEDGKLLKKVK